MAKDKKIKLETLSQTSKKKKDFLIVAGIASVIGLVGMSVFTFSLDIDKQKVYKNRNMASLKNSQLKITPKENIKESWAMSVENTFKEQQKYLIQFMKEVKETRAENQKELSTLIENSQKETEGKIFDLTETMNKNLDKMRKDVQESLLKQDNRIEELKLMTRSGTNISIDGGSPEEKILLNEDLIPKIDKNARDRRLKELLSGNDNSGKRNSNGHNGTSGTSGFDGSKGSDGYDGQKGSDGYDGINGVGGASVAYTIVKDKNGNSAIRRNIGFELKPRLDKNGVPVKDANGKIIMERIPKGVLLTPLLDDNGNIVKDKDGDTIFINEETNERFRIKMKDGKEVIVNENNEIVDTKIYEKVKGEVSYSIKKDKDGEAIILDNNGNRLTKLKDFNGKYVTNDEGKQVWIDLRNGKKLTAEVDENGKLVLVDENNRVLESVTDSKGIVKFLNKAGAILKKKKVTFFSINTEDVKKYSLKEKRKELSEIKRRAKAKNTYHIMTGLTTAYLVTGVYAPAFAEGKMEPLPVLLQAEGDILIANDDTESLGKCFFLGSAKGNMNSETADIRLNKVSCSLADGTKKIEGSISGWVIGENGIPGVPGQLLHKNGAWLAKTFVAGFLDTFAQSITAFAGAGGKDGSGAISIGDSLAEAGGESTSQVFQQIGSYYLEMAAQIFPVIEVKPGRTVDILLKGGDILTVTDFNSAEIEQIETDIKELEQQKEEDERRLREMEYQNDIKELSIGTQSAPEAGRSFSVKTKTNDLFSEGGK